MQVHVDDVITENGGGEISVFINTRLHVYMALVMNLQTAGATQSWLHK